MKKYFRLFFKLCAYSIKKIRRFKEIPYYIKTLKKFIKSRGADKDFPFWTWYPILDDRTADSGSVSIHYFFQDIYVARKIFANNPNNHLDIGSSISGFVAHVSVFRQIDVLDIRPLPKLEKNISFIQSDLLNIDTKIFKRYVSISALHSIEHFGLGRYGDQVDYYAHIKAINVIYDILLPNGVFYFSVPIGKQRVEFNAHRVFSLNYLSNLFTNKFKIKSFSYINDKNIIIENIPIENIDLQNNFGCNYGCGIFELIKI